MLEYILIYVQFSELYIWSRIWDDPVYILYVDNAVLPLANSWLQINGAPFKASVTLQMTKNHLARTSSAS